jgi:hypothetical protein
MDAEKTNFICPQCHNRIFIKTQFVAEKIRTIMDLGDLTATEEHEALVGYPAPPEGVWVCTGCRYNPTAAESAILHEILASKALRWGKPVRP